MALRPIESISGLFDTDEGKLVGIFPTGTNDVSYLPTSEKRVSGDPVASVVNPLTGGLEIQAGGKILPLWLRRKLTAAQQCNAYNAPLSAVTVTDAAASTDLAVAYPIRANINAGLFRISGGVLAGTNPNNAEVKSASILTGSNVGVAGALQNAPAIECVVSPLASQFRVKFYVGGGSYTAQYRVRINGRLVKRTMTAFSSVGAVHTLTADLTSFDAGASRLVRVEWDGAAVAQSVSIDAGTMWEPREAERRRVVVYGDSFSSYGASRSPHTAWLAQACDLMGLEYWMSGVGGTGALNNGGGNYLLTEDARISDLTMAQFDAAILEFGSNDVGNSSAAIQAAASVALAKARAALPGKLLIVAGVPNAQAGAGVVTMAQAEAAIAAAVSALGDPRIVFVPVSTEASGAWITAGNSAAMIADGTHYTASGEVFAAQRFVSALSQQIPIF